jgi:hypothetical protein
MNCLACSRWNFSAARSAISVMARGSGMVALLGLCQPHQASALPLLAFDECSVMALPAAT